MKLKRMFMIVLLVLLAAACSQQDEQTGEEAINEQESAESKSTFPLTGIATNESTDARAIAVMVNNHTLARQQSGLQDADMVYEILAEGEVTRFLAVYQSEFPERVGPVRSAREYYIQLAKGMDAIYIHHGYSPEAKELLESGYIDHLDGLTYDGTLFMRDKSRKSPHNSYIAFSDIIKGAEENSFALEGAPKPLKFLDEEELASLTGSQGSSFTVTYGNASYDVSYEYSESDQAYKRFSADEQTVDHDTGEPVLLDNIVVIEAKHEVVDEEGRRDIDLQSGGKGYLMQKGIWNEIEWTNQDNQLKFMINQEEVKLVPGKTWINIIPDDPGLETAVAYQ
ncbi:MAG: DUF3048 domain-containing protein [Bacillus sp. (in: firmicutes)]